MKRLETRQSGSTLLIVAVAIALVVVGGLVVYRVRTASTNSIETKAKYTTKSDITSAKSALGDVPVDSDLDASQLDKDVTDLR